MSRVKRYSFHLKQNMSSLLLKIYIFAVLAVLPIVLSRSANSAYQKPLKYKERNAEQGTAVTDPRLRFYLRPPRSVVMTDTENGRLECQAGGIPPPKLHWLKDGKRIYQDESDDENDLKNSDEANGVRKLGISATNTRLYIDCASLEDSGEYTCVAENPYHRTSTRTDVTVLPTKYHRKNCASRTPQGKPARIHMWSRRMLEYIGGDVKLFCRAHGSPKPEIKWLGTEDEPLSYYSDKYEILDNGDLIIRHLQWSDMGNYVCIATNEHGSDRTETFLYPTMPEK